VGDPSQLTFVTAADLVAVLDRTDPGHRLAGDLWQLEFDAGATLVTTDHSLLKASVELQKRYGPTGVIDLLEIFLPALRLECCARADLDLAIAALLASSDGSRDLIDRVDDQVRRRLRVARGLRA